MSFVPFLELRPSTPVCIAISMRMRFAIYCQVILSFMIIMGLRFVIPVGLWLAWVSVLLARQRKGGWVT
jgi:hypothetical protein